MGRHAGWIAAYVGIATGAHVTLLPEFAVDLDRTCEIVRRRHAGREGYSLVVVAEGVSLPGGGLSLVEERTDAFGHARLGGVGDQLAAIIERRTGVEARAVRLGYVQRGGAPCAFDRVLSTRFGYAAADLVRRSEFGKMVALRGTQVAAVPLSESLAALKTVDRDLYELMRAMET
jgi:6-phosphofructokinase 1